MGGIQASDRYVEEGYIENQDGYISYGPVVFWQDKIVVIPRNMLTWLHTDQYMLDTALLKQQINFLEASEMGVAHDRILEHTAGTLMSGVFFAGFLIFINDYKVTFENGIYSANVNQMYNINLMDVVTANYVSVRVQNSAGLQTITSGVSGLSTQEHDILVGLTPALTQEEVWSYANRTITQQTGLTADEHIQVMNGAPTSGVIAAAVWNHDIGS